MSISRKQESALTGIYSLARKSGLLATTPGQWMFSKAYFFYKRHLEDPFYSFLDRRPDLLKGGNVLDVGANIGYTSLLFSHAIDPDFKVYSFEPELYNFRLLNRVAGSSQAQGRIVAIQAAAGDRDGVAELSLNPRHHGDHRVLTDRFRESVQSTSLCVSIMKVDTFVASQKAPFPIRFIKVDVQGYETAVCKGMERTLESNPGAVLALEYMPQAMRELGFQPEDLLTWIKERNYRIYTLSHSGMLEPLSADRIGEQAYGDLLVSHEKLIL